MSLRVVAGWRLVWLAACVPMPSACKCPWRGLKAKTPPFKPSGETGCSGRKGKCLKVVQALGCRGFTAPINAADEPRPQDPSPNVQVGISTVVICNSCCFCIALVYTCNISHSYSRVRCEAIDGTQAARQLQPQRGGCRGVLPVKATRRRVRV